LRSSSLRWRTISLRRSPLIATPSQAIPITSLGYYESGLPACFPCCV